MKLLALDTSTETLSVAVSVDRDGAGAQVWAHEAPGGAQASATLIPAVLLLLQQADVKLAELDAIAFGQGPGSFTGLRTACSVAQGLAMGSGVILLPVDSLLAVAEQARHDTGAQRVMAVLDARMDQVYAALWQWDEGRWHCQMPTVLQAPDELHWPADVCLAGNARAAYGTRLHHTGPEQHTLPTAAAMLRLAPALLAAGQGVSAEHAMPTYIRDKVAQTTEERAAAKAALLPS